MTTLIEKAQKATGIEAVEHFHGKEGELIVKLMEQGLDKETAKIKAKEMLQKLNKAHSNEGATSMALGLFILIVGLVITFGTGTNTIMYGAILVGASMFIRGIIQMREKLE
jgi:predicted phage tail protein